jgi:hypothetical protein
MFKKAEKKQLKIKMGLSGPSGSGKTYTALSIASGLGSKIAVMDTEHASSERYADLFDFDVLNQTNFHHGFIRKTLNEAVRLGYDVLIIDSMSHFWNSKGGILEVVDNNSSKGMQAWKMVNPMINDMYDAIKEAPIHVICTLRVKTEYVEETNSRNKKLFVKAGLAPVFKDGIDYEFDLMGELTIDHELTCSKTRICELSSKVFENPSAEFGETLRNWAEGGSALPSASDDEWAKVIRVIGEAVTSNDSEKSSNLYTYALGKYTLTDEQAKQLLELITPKEAE